MYGQNFRFLFAKLPISRSQTFLRTYCRPSVFPEEHAQSKVDEKKLPPLPEFSDDLIHHLEQLSLVRFSDEKALEHLKIAVRYAQRLSALDTENVHPMYSVLENRALHLRDDDDPNGNAPRAEIMANAVETVDDYFTAPVGNVPLEERIDKLGKKNF